MELINPSGAEADAQAAFENGTLAARSSQRMVNNSLSFPASSADLGQPNLQAVVVMMAMVPVVAGVVPVMMIPVAVAVVVIVRFCVREPAKSGREQNKGEGP